MSGEWREFVAVGIICVLLILAFLATIFRDG